MTTLQQIGTTVAGGSCVFIPSMIFFGVAVRYRSTFIATRATARPPSVIYESNPVSASQQRGGPMLGWIPWTLSLSYDTMLTGVPGTGTREQGLSGSLLKVNLDGIVLLRFHAVCLRVCTTAAILYVVLGIPIYLSAQCYSGGEVEQAAHCSTNSYNLTNYQRTTLANVPAITNTNPTHTIGNKHGGILWRLYAIVFCFWIVALRLCHLLHAEWVQLLAMRRVYYLEYDVWGQRREELKQTLLYEEIATYKREKIHELQKQEQASEHHYRAKHFTFNHLGSHDNNNNNNDEFPKEGDRLTLSMAAANAAVTAVSLKGVTRNPEGHLTDREPWIPHPEQRDTVPNVALYSILVGGLPSLPEQAADSFNAEATIQFSKRESIDWQLSLTTTFFDHCVPNQPGFSSSVAAVTIIPGALDLSVAWRKWYAAASKLRRLRFIREQIAIRRHYDIEAAGSSSGGDDDNAEDDLAKYEYGDANDYGYGDHNEADNEDIMVPADASEDEVSSYLAGVPPPRADWSVLDKTPRGIYETSLKNQEYYKQVLGTALGTEHDTHIYDSLEFGPEQAAVYAREFAQSAAPCCPNGCHERGVTRAPIDRLIEMERTVAVEVHQANLELREARRRATRTDSLNALNLHDQQQRQQPTVAGATAHSCIGGGGVASPHSCIGGTTTAPIFIPSKRVHEEGGEESDGEDIVQSMQAQPMASRYDRRGSANADDGKKVDRPKLSRLNPDRLGAVSGDLDLEAQLYKKTDSRTSISNAQVKKSPPVDKIIKPASINRRTPSLEGLKFPNGITLEAQLAQDASNRSKGSYHQRPVNSILADIPENDSALRQRKVSSRADDSSNKCSEKRTALQHTDRFSDNTSSAQWAQVETIITETRDSERTASGIISSSLAVATGQWTWPKFNWQLTGTKRRSKKLNKWAAKLSKEAVEKMARESTYAVVTFTSRQAAVAARACLADGRGAGRWMTLKDMPIPPLADAAPGDLMTFRNCCRPVTLSKWLKWLQSPLLVLIAWERFVRFLFAFVYWRPFSWVTTLFNFRQVLTNDRKVVGTTCTYTPSTLEKGLVSCAHAMFSLTISIALHSARWSCLF